MVQAAIIIGTGLATTGFLGLASTKLDKKNKRAFSSSTKYGTNNSGANSSGENSPTNVPELETNSSTNNPGQTSSTNNPAESSSTSNTAESSSNKRKLAEAELDEINKEISKKEKLLDDLEKDVSDTLQKAYDEQHDICERINRIAAVYKSDLSREDYNKLNDITNKFNETIQSLENDLASSDKNVKAKAELSKDQATSDYAVESSNALSQSGGIPNPLKQMFQAVNERAISSKTSVEQADARLTLHNILAGIETKNIDELEDKASKVRGSLIDDFADVSTELPDYTGGDD